MSPLPHYHHEERPWGAFEQFTANEPSTVKILYVAPGKRLSLQRHAKRSEWWRVIEGDGTVALGSKEYAVSVGDEIEIPVGMLHRLSGGPRGLTVLEIGFGEFDENDIVRVEDDFGRAPAPARPRGVLCLRRAEGNPILKPGYAHWEAIAVLNPAAIRDGERTHLFYRAIGTDGVSRLGYASSKDGVTLDERLPYPIFAHENPLPARGERYDPGTYGSGGSWTGVEDPRAVVIDGRVYVTYNAFNGWDSIRVGLTSISLTDLRAKRWNFTAPKYLSPPGQRHKNWVLFPEKINGKFALFHNLHAGNDERVRVDYVDDPLAQGAEAPCFESPDPHLLPDHPCAWHRRMRSIGPPPVRTPFGWLTVYHAMDPFEPRYYKLGAMLLDSGDPRKVIARSPVPVLEPEAPYEVSEGVKPGIIYSCGAVIIDDKLIVYYGAADTVVCAAAAPLLALARALLAGEP